MFIADLIETGPLSQSIAQEKPAQETTYMEADQPQVVVVYPGRFQPFHLGHADVFQSLQNKFGRDHVYIATSNKVEPPKSPFNFNDKMVFMTAAGVPADRIIEVQSPYLLPKQFDPASTIFIVAVGAPDSDRLKPDSYKKDGQPAYYKTFANIKDCVTADKHGYVIIAAERKKIISIKGQQVDVSHGTQSRAVWNSVRNDEQGRAEYMKQMFGRNDPEIGRILDKIPATVGEDSNMPVANDSTSPIHSNVEEGIDLTEYGLNDLIALGAPALASAAASYAGAKAGEWLAKRKDKKSKENAARQTNKPLQLPYTTKKDVELDEAARLMQKITKLREQLARVKGKK